MRWFAVPVYCFVRLFWPVFWLINPYKVTTVEVVIGVQRIFIQIFAFVVVGKQWNARIKKRLGIGLLWASRMVAVFEAVQQAVAKEEDPHAMAGLVSYVCFGYLFIPNFVEYFCTLLVLPYIQPVCLYLVGEPAEHVQQILYQHTLILALGLSISWSVHTDCRSDWLRYPAPSKNTKHKTTTPSDQLSSSPVLAREDGSSRMRVSETSAAAENDDWDHFDDGYFTDADRAEMRADAIQVRGTRALAARAADPVALSRRKGTKGVDGPPIHLHRRVAPRR
jgi:hypothetical protein